MHALLCSGPLTPQQAIPVMPSSHLILCRPLLLLPPIPPKTPPEAPGHSQASLAQPKKKKCKKAKWLSQEAFQIAEKGKEAKGKEEKERHTKLNTEFQRIAKRDRKTFLSDQCKEIEDNSRMGKTKDLFKKIRDTKGTFQAKMGSIKDINCVGLTKAEDIKKRWQEQTEELFNIKAKHKCVSHSVIFDSLQSHGL